MCGDVAQAWYGSSYADPKSPGMGALKRVTAPYGSVVLNVPFTVARVAQFGNAEQIGRYPSAKAKYRSETDSEQVQ